MSRYSGTGWYDGYGYHDAKGIDPRHKHEAIHPKFRSTRDDMRRDGFGWTSNYNATPMNPSLRSVAVKGKAAPSKAATPKPAPAD